MYNVGSGVAWSIRQVLEALCSFSPVAIDIRSDPERLRPVDVPRLVADATRLTKRTNWRPVLPVLTALHQTLEYWRAAVAEIAVT